MRCRLRPSLYILLINFRDLAKVLHGAGCALSDIQLSMQRAALAIHIDRYSDPDGAMSEEVFGKMSTLITETLIDELRLIDSCDDLVRKQPDGQVLRLVPDEPVTIN